MRQHYSNEVSIRLVKKSLEIFQHFPDMFDGTEVLHNVGWYFLVPPEAADIFHDNMAQLKRLGVRTWEVSLEDAAEALPGLNMEGIGCVAHEPDSGYVDPHGMVSAFAAKARTNGAEVYLQTPARDIKLRDGRVSAVVTDQGEISTPIVVNAAGPWAKAVGQLGRVRPTSGSYTRIRSCRPNTRRYTAHATLRFQHGRPNLLAS